MKIMSNYNKETLVAYIDISGFRKMMEENPKKTFRKMKSFYRSGFNLLKQCENEKHCIKGVFFSDLGILYTKIKDPKEQISDLLKIVKEINQELLKEEIMLKTSITYGDFKFPKLKVHNYIEKKAIYGEGYLHAYLNAEVWRPKLEAGQCRIFLKDSNSIYKTIFESNRCCKKRDLLKKNNSIDKNGNEYLYYYWMVDNQQERDIENIIENFESDYTEACETEGNKKYKKIKEVLKRFVK